MAKLVLNPELSLRRVLTVLRGDIIAHEGLRNEAHIRRHVQQSPALGLVNIPEEFNGLSRHIGSTPKVDLEHGPGSVLRGTLDFAHEAVTGVVEDEVDATNVGLGVLERGIDVLAFGHIEFEDDQLVFGPLGTESVQGGRGTEGRDRDPALLENGLGHAATKAC